MTNTSDSLLTAHEFSARRQALSNRSVHIVHEDCEGRGQQRRKLMGEEYVNLLGLAPQALVEFFATLGEKPFRAKQVLQWVHQRGIAEFEAMSDLSKALRDRLSACAHIQAPRIDYQHESTDGTYKWLMALDDGQRVETVFIPERDRGTLCVSSQVGCALDCQFCSTAKQGYNRNLSSAEIIGQLWLANQVLGQLPVPRKVTNVVMMGMGEPLLNFDAVIPAMQLMLDDHAYGLSKRRVTISTSGIIPAIDRLSDTLDVALAVSLHAPNDELRSQIMPINRKYPLEELLAACRRYAAKSSASKRITMEYVLLEGINDQPQHARELVKLLRDVPSKVNLIPFNPFPATTYRRSSEEAIARFFDILHAADYTVITRKTRGDDIAAACGQLVGDVRDRTARTRHNIPITIAKAA